MAKNKNAFNAPSFRINDELRGNYDVRIVGDGIESKVVTLEEAKKIAYGMELDLIELNAKNDPPIMKVASYEKLVYELKKNAKKNKQGAKPLKEIQLSVNISDHDLQTKANNARKFIENGNKVKATLTMKGRELTRRDESKRSILEFIVMLEDVAVPESQLRDDGNKTIVVLKKKG
jgi:translation initiation factor IF-3